MKTRPRRVISADGKLFLNLWFIPHYTEIMQLFSNLQLDESLAVLEQLATIGLTFPSLYYFHAPEYSYILSTTVHM